MYTEEAVRRFQTDCGLEPTGIADDYTIDYVSQYCTSPQDGATATSSPQSGPAAGPAAIVDENGAIVSEGTAQVLNREGALGDLGAPAREALELLLSSNTYTAPIPVAIDLANALGWTVAMGYDSDLAGSLGVTGGMALYFSSGDEWGLYSSIGADLGAVIGVNVSSCFTAVNGGSDKLAGECFAIEASGGEGITAGLSVLFSFNGDFLGVAGEVGYGFGIPANAYASFNTTRLMSF